MVGTEVRVRATPGVTAEYLQRALTCHAMGTHPAASPNDPLRPKGGLAEVNVVSIGHSFAVSLMGNDIAASKDAHARAKAMIEASQSTVTVRDVGTAVAPTSGF